MKKKINKKIKKILIFSGLFILLLIPILSLIRIISPSQIDDIHPSIYCPELRAYNIDVLWIIPKYNNEKISNNQEWCKEILSLNKTLGLHGYTHSYREFEGNVNKEQLEEAINIFKECFGFSPEIFKPPQLALSKENADLIKEYNLTIKNKFNQFTHKVYHCNDSGLFPNWFINLF